MRDNGQESELELALLGEGGKKEKGMHRKAGELM